MYAIDHPDLTVSNFMGNSIGTQRVKLMDMKILTSPILAAAWENLSSVVCEPQRRRPACV